MTEDGWYRTGDIAMYLPNGAFKIVDRIYNISKTQSGTYVAPTYIENIYGESQLVS